MSAVHDDPEEEAFGEAFAAHYDHGDDAHVIVLRGILDWRTEEFLRDAIEHARRSHRRLVVDLSGVSYANIDVLALFLAARTSPGLSFTAPVPEPIAKLLDTTGTTEVFTVHATLADALSRPPGAPRA
ncbi:STAS domain-containing protein [Streptomyces sp. H10-C2]|uniref:STAS domain-containing protein n=1 Tax=unclassified Streptomyces TaxID=2593676 RepID=UPI0024BBEB56|nr:MULTISPECIES: STAS domain-containing protein [unclassified Streptomyces]MDJ0344081.1 STAS domain-containing protein [Streptomyces sp. PH10-H1]MDJ0368620.1 STAS domain-containing protein [Streptomyces sp. H10-C2]